MKRKHKVKLLAAGLVAVLLLSGCSTAGESKNQVDLNSLPLEELVAKAKEDGEVNSVGMPDTWANWGETWKGITKEYGIKHTDTDMSSAEELALFESEKNNATKDIGDVGQSFGPIAVDKGLALPYKTSYWDSIPDWAKDEDGHWIIAYYGTISIFCNADLVKTVPQSFDDILKGDYKVSVGDVAKATQSQNAVLAAAIAYGGSESNIQPGLDYFRKLAEQGRLDLGEQNLTRMEKGEIAVAFLWDYNSLNYRDQFKKANPQANFVINIPAEASIQSGYTTIINRYSTRPYAAALAREYILSDAGQINLARGYAKPVRDVELPADVKSMLLAEAQYTNARLISDQNAWDTTTKTLGEQWQEQVLAYAK
ncbi:putative spermidine/putrescine transport system substrate-binding protein [Desulfitobacterium sp. LBE]|uniref:ABC transporter substrate-binding protein n=1 Tax=Desulfitobacterium sp. LBE TaxID=884086 RepID=UPI001199AA71|nr:ABC transporter substrate-binding protein [Desulfitobacterium sp. LBE]TWH55969.1 putative spermidine/putrescine transport system substrate-binding protein [Desulfitobacterium sp. LBE]